MGKKSREKKERREFFKSLSLDSTKPVTLKELQHLEFRVYVHVWQKIGNVFVSLTESPELKKLEASIGFNEQNFWSSVDLQIPKNDIDGFYFRNHKTKESEHFPATKWSIEVENWLIDKGVARKIPPIFN